MEQNVIALKAGEKRFARETRSSLLASQVQIPSTDTRVIRCFRSAHSYNGNHTWGERGGNFLPDGNTSLCFAPTARPKHYRRLRYLRHAPRATGRAVINKPRLAACGKRIPEVNLLRVSVFYVHSLPSTTAVSEKLSETCPGATSPIPSAIINTCARMLI